MASKPTVLVVGSTGMLGTKIVSALLDKGATVVKAMVRPGSDSKQENRQKLEQMKAQGATIVEGDLMKPETLLPICEGVDEGKTCLKRVHCRTTKSCSAAANCQGGFAGEASPANTPP